MGRWLAPVASSITCTGALKPLDAVLLEGGAAMDSAASRPRSPRLSLRCEIAQHGFLEPLICGLNVRFGCRGIHRFDALKVIGAVSHGAPARRSPLLRLARQIGGNADGDVASLDGGNQLRRALIADHSSAGDGSLRDIECSGGSPAGNLPRGRLICPAVAAVRKSRQLRRDHGPLALSEMSADKVLGDDVGERLAHALAIEGLAEVRWLNASEHAGRVAIAAFENFPFVQNDGVMNAMRPDVVGQLTEGRIVHHREQVGERVVFERLKICRGRHNACVLINDGW